MPTNRPMSGKIRVVAKRRSGRQTRPIGVKTPKEILAQNILETYSGLRPEETKSITAAARAISTRFANADQTISTTTIIKILKEAIAEGKIKVIKPTGQGGRRVAIPKKVLDEIRVFSETNPGVSRKAMAEFFSQKTGLRITLKVVDKARGVKL